MKEEQKLFGYMELKAMCMLCVAEAVLLATSFPGDGIIDPKSATDHLQKKVEEVIDIRWYSEEKA